MDKMIDYPIFALSRIRAYIMLNMDMKKQSRNRVLLCFIVSYGVVNTPLF